MANSIGAVDYSTSIPNNVDLAGDRRVLRALERWHPNYLDWWKDMGPEGFQEALVYLRTAVSVDREGWATFDYVKMPDYRWGILLAPQEEGRTIPFGQHKGEPVWQEVPGEYRALPRRLIVIQGDTEPASVEQQRHLGATAPSLYDLRNLFQVNVEEGRHLWAMVYLLQKYFGADGREEAEDLLRRRSGHEDSPRMLGAFNERTPDWLSFFMFTFFTDRDGKMQWVTISPVLEGEEFTVQYVDNLTSTTSERREYLRQEYYFGCQCERCVGDQTYDVSLVKVDDEQHLNELSDLHSRAEVAMCESTEKACSLFQAALAHTPCKNHLHRLHYKSADGVLLCGKQSKHAQSLIVAARKILDFYERQPHEPHLPTSRVWALLKLARAYTWINRRAKRNDYAEEARMAVSRVIEILRPFQCDLSGLEWWLEELGSISGSLTVAEIFWGPNEL